MLINDTVALIQNLDFYPFLITLFRVGFNLVAYHEVANLGI